MWTFALIDLAGFTALTESHGDDTAADLAMHFVDVAHRHLTPRDRLIKTLGDAVLLASDSPGDALTLVRGILDEAYGTDGFPLARVGLHHGPAVERRDDMFGAAINLTARVAATAAGGQVLATSIVADAARAADVVTSSVGHFSLKNVAEQVELWDLVLCGSPDGTTMDPVCRMLIRQSTAAGRLRVDEAEYYFCSLNCAGQFARAPEAFQPPQ